MKILTKTLLATALLATTTTAIAETDIEKQIAEFTKKSFQIDVLVATGDNTELDATALNLSADPQIIEDALKAQGASVTQNGYAYSSQPGEWFTIDETYTFDFDDNEYQRGLQFSTMFTDEPAMSHVRMTFDAVAGLQEVSDTLYLNTETHTMSETITYSRGSMVMAFDFKDMNENNRIEDKTMYFIVNIK